MRGLEDVWRGASRHQSLIIYLPKNQTTNVWRTPLQNNKDHTKQCGKGSDVEQMRRMSWDEDDEVK